MSRGRSVSAKSFTIAINNSCLRAARETLDGLGWLAEDPRRVATTADIGERMAGALGAGAPEALREKADQMLAPENLPKYAGDVAEQVAELERRLVRAEEEAAQRKAAQKRQRQQRNGRKSRHQPEQDPKGASAGASGGGSPSRRGKPSRSVAQVERDFGLDGSLRGSFSQPLSDHYRLAAANQRFKPSGGERNVLDKLASDNPQLEGVPHCEVLCRLFRDLELLAAGHDTQLLKLVPVAATEAGRKKRKKKRSGTGDSATALVGKEAVFSLLHKAAAQRPAQRLGNIRWAAPSRQASRPAVKAATRQ